jgi:xanthine/uracil permease
MLIKAADTKRNALIICVGLGLGLAVTFEPTLLQHLPRELANFFHSGITTGTVATVLLNHWLPKSGAKETLDAFTESTNQLNKERERYHNMESNNTIKNETQDKHRE